MNKIAISLTLVLVAVLASSIAAFSQGPPSVRVTNVNPSSGTAPVTPVVTYTASVPMTVYFSINGSRVGQAAAAMGTNTWTFPTLTTAGTYALTITCPGGSSTGYCTVSPPPPPPPAISLSPTSTSVGYSSTSTTFTLTNTGGSALSWNATIAGCVTSFTVNPPAAGQLGPGSSVQITAYYNVNTGTARSGTVTISGTGASSRTFTVTQAAGPAIISLSPTSQSVPYSSTWTTFKITNTGGSTLSWSPAKAGCVTSVSPSSGTLNPGSSVTDTVFYNANTGAATSGTVTISQAGGSATPQTFTVNQAAGPAIISLSPISQSVSYSSTWTTFKITNTGGSTLSWSPAKAGCVTRVGPSGGTLNAGGSVTDTVFYNANTGAATSGTVTVSQPGSGITPQTFTVNQAAAPPMILTYTYNQLGQTAGVGNASSSNYYASYTYNPDGTVYQEKINNSTATTTYSYNARGFLTQIMGAAFIENVGYSNGYNGAAYYNGSIAYDSFLPGPGGAAYSNYNFQYDQNNRMTVAQNTNNSAYSYGVNAPAITYDNNGNITRRSEGSNAISFTYSGSNAPVAYINNGTSYILNRDPDGNVTYNQSRNISFTYDPFTLLTMSVYQPSSANQLTFEYDGRKERVLTTAQSNSYPTVQTLYLRGTSDYPLTTLTGSSSSNTTRYYVYGPAGLIAVVDNGTTYFIAKDHLGSTCGVLNSSNNSKNSWYAYTPYGNVWTGSVNEDPAYKFTGQEYEQEFGLYNFRAREYDPTLGIFYAADAAGQGFSPYMYCGGKPTMFTDPTGAIFGIDDAIFTAMVLSIWNGIVAADDQSGGHISRWHFKDFAAGAASSAVSSGVGGLLGTPSSLLGAIGEGAVSGAVSGAVDAAIEGENMESSILYSGLESGALGGLLYELPSGPNDLLESNDGGGYPPRGPYYRDDAGNVYDASGRLVQLEWYAPEVNVSARRLRFLTPQERQMIVASASNFLRVPYRSGAGATSSKSTGGDCSGDVHCVYSDAGFSYPYTTSTGFENSPYFQEVSTPQQGDLVDWPGHVAIYDPTLSGGNNIWTTRSSKGYFWYGNTNMWHGTPRYYEYIGGR